MNESMHKIYTPEQHILVCETYAKDGVVFCRMKKHGRDITEDITLDDFLKRIFTAVNS